MAVTLRLLKAGALLHSLAGNHPLVDGNKRLGWLATYVFLAKNGVGSTRTTTPPKKRRLPMSAAAVATRSLDRPSSRASSIAASINARPIPRRCVRGRPPCS